ncbi:transposase family protein [Allorhizobium terrae]|uniref:Transposase family protein n=2 Tax=Allorhizobium terrae TaxID=1848972 RepID=A0A4S3ZNA2_9HYPH|nr:transposase family protein [Allorhizobium terrae]
MERFIECFGDIEDPRAANARHDLYELLFIALLASLCGAQSAILLLPAAHFWILEMIHPLWRGSRMERFIECFGDIEDPRAANARHDLYELLFIALLASLCGAQTCEENPNRFKVKIMQHI